MRRSGGPGLKRQNQKMNKQKLCEYLVFEKNSSFMTFPT